LRRKLLWLFLSAGYIDVVFKAPMDLTEEHKGRRPELSAEAFQLLLTRLAPDRETAAREYERLQARLANYFRLKGLSGCCDLADLTLDRVASLLTTKAVDDLPSFCYGVARLICLEQYRSEHRQRTANDVFGRETIDEVDVDRYQSMQDCLAKLTAEDQELLKDYFSELSPKERSANRESLARKAGISLDRLRLRIHRLRLKLEDCLTKAAKK
jgi:DNA-directed RNA polymerase specialized sigma24 family protein